MPIIIKAKPAETLPYVEAVRHQADGDRNALGFLPGRGYEESALLGKLLVAVIESPREVRYAGHLLFGGVYPQARIFQLYVPSEFRQRGIAKALLRHLCQKLTAENWLSITAKVASDLPANRVWEKFGFSIARVVAGGATRGRRINIRGLNLNTPSLFDALNAPSPHEFRLAYRLSSRKPLYLMDLNVFFDVVKQRARSIDAGKIIAAALDNRIRLTIADEFVRELQRTSYDPSDDPALEFALRQTQLPRPPEKDLKLLLPELAALIFKNKTLPELTAQDNSDLIHLATGIHHKVSGFITSEKAILQAGPSLRERHGLDVIGVSEFAELMTRDSGLSVLARAKASHGGLIEGRTPNSADLVKIREFLIERHASHSLIHEACLEGHDAPERQIIYDSDMVVAYAHWYSHPGPQPSIDIFLCGNEDHDYSEGAIEHLLETAPISVGRISPCLIRLHTIENDSATRNIAIAHGFTLPEGRAHGGGLQRLYIRRAITPENWATTRHQIKSVSDVTLPAEIPSYLHPSQELPLKLSGGRDLRIGLNELERFLAPAILLLPGRDGVIVSIKHDFSEDLFRSSPQGSILAPPEAVLRQERIYISSSGNKSILTEGSPILFYESQGGQGRGAIIAMARITRTQLVKKKSVLPAAKKRGVIDDRTIELITTGPTIAEVSFDNILILDNPVELRRLRELGCADGSNLVRARRITSTKVIQVASEGMKHV